MLKRLWIVMFAAIATITAAHPGDGIVVDKNGDVYFVAMHPIEGPPHYAAVFKVTGKHEAELVYKSQYGSSNLYITLGRDGHMYVAERNYLGLRDGEDAYLTRIKRLNPDGTATEIHGEMSGRSPYGGSSYIVDEDSNLFYVNRTEFKRLSLQGELKSLPPVPIAGLLVWGPEGDIYFTSGVTVFVRKSDGTTSEVTDQLMEIPFEHVVWGEGSSIFGMVVAPDRHVFLADWNHRRVQQVSPTGEITTALKSEAPYTPEGVAYHNGALYVFETTGPSTDGILPRVRTVDTKGNVSTIYEFKEVAQANSGLPGGTKSWIYVVALGIALVLLLKARPRAKPGH